MLLTVFSNPAREDARGLSRRSYQKSLTDFLAWYAVAGDGDGFTKATVQRYARELIDRGLAASTVNVRLTAVRRLAAEAADNGLMAPELAAGISRVKGARQHGARMGNCLSLDQTELLLAAPNVATMKGKRDRALLAVLIGCGLRRSEVASLTFEHVQQRDGRWAIVDLQGKGNRTRTVPMPSWTKMAIDRWAEAAGLATGWVFRAMNNLHELTGTALLPQNIMEAVNLYGKRIGVAKLAPHDPVSFEQKRRLVETLVAGIRVDTVETGGDKRANVTVTYRFSQPDQPPPIVLPQSYSTGNVAQIPAELKTIGDHIRKKRLALKLHQKEVAKLLGVTTSCVHLWEIGASSPMVGYMPAVIQFLGYNPLPEATSIGARLVQCRQTLGLSQKDAAGHIGVDQGTLAKWERGEREPSGNFWTRVARFLTEGEVR